jgi:hypothetical protein
MLDAATGKFDQGLQLQDYAAESRVKEKLYKLRRSTAAWHSQSQSARYESVLGIHFSNPNTQRLRLEACSVNIRACGPLPTCEELYNPATALRVVDRF